ncbi:MAG: thiamine phosphate synthase [Desulfovibrio sp.]
MQPDYGVYLVTDRALCLGRDLLDVVAGAVRGGTSMVQLREKHCDTRDFVALARRLVELLRPLDVPLLINDRVDVALAAGVDGVHVGQSDMHPADVRALMGPRALVGLSVECMEHVLEAEKLGVDYLGVGPVYATATKPDHSAPWGLEGLRRVRSASSLPMVGIGSVNAENAAQVLATGMDGLAVISAICSAPSPETASRTLRTIVEAVRRDG